MQKSNLRHEKKAANKLFENGRFLWGFFSCFLLLVLAHLIFPVPEFVALVSKNSSAIQIGVSLTVAVLSLFVAYKAMSEQRKAREAGTDPILIAHLGQRIDAREMITFKVSNVGAGAAVNVRLNVDEPESGIGGKNIIVNIFRRHHPFTVIPQNSAVEFSLALGWELLGSEPLGIFTADLIYEDVEGNEYEATFPIDVRQMEGLGAEKSPQMRVVKSLEVIAKNFS